MAMGEAGPCKSLIGNLGSDGGPVSRTCTKRFLSSCTARSLKKSIWLTKCLGFQFRRERSQTEVSSSDFGKVGCSFRVAEKFTVICLILLH